MKTIDVECNNQEVSIKQGDLLKVSGSDGIFLALSDISNGSICVVNLHSGKSKYILSGFVSYFLGTITIEQE